MDFNKLLNPYLGPPGASLLAVDEGFAINLGNFADSGTLASPVMFPASATGVDTAYNGVNPDEWTLAFLLTAQAGTPPSTTFAVHFKLTTAVGTGS